MALATHFDFQAQPEIVARARCDRFFTVSNRVNLVVGLAHFQGQFISTEQEHIFDVWLLGFKQ